MDTLLTVIAVVVGIAALAFVGVAVYVIYAIKRYQPPVLGAAGLVGGSIYVGSPIDFLPELALGPIGLADDAAVVASILAYIWHLRGVYRDRRALARR